MTKYVPAPSTNFKMENRLGDAVGAISEDNLGALRELLTIEPSLIRAQDRKGLCLLHHAAAKGNARALEFLLDSGKGDLISICNIVDHRGFTPVFYSQTADVVEVFLATCPGILKLTRNMNSLRPPTLLDSCKAKGILSETIEKSLFHFQAHESAVDALCKGELQRLTEIVDAYPKVTGECDIKGLTLLHRAADAGQLEILQFLLLNEGANLKNACNRKDLYGRTPVFWSNSTQIVELFLEKCSGSLELECNGLTLLSQCRASGMASDAVENALSRQESSWRFISRVERGDLVAVKEMIVKDPEMIRYIAATTIRINSRIAVPSDESRQGCNAMHIAVNNNDLESVRFLIHSDNTGRMYKATNSSSETPLFMAHTAEAVELFLEAGLPDLKVFGEYNYPLFSYCHKHKLLSHKIELHLPLQAKAHQLQNSIARHDLDAVTNILGANPEVMRFQGLEYRTPFHWAARAAEDDKLDILKFMVQLARKASNSMQPPAYNMEDRIGDTPILRIFKSTAAVEFLLFDSGLDDLELRNPKNSVMLIERCVGFGMLTPRIIQRLLHQVNDPFDPPTFYSSIDIDMLEMLLACEGLNDDAIEMVDGEPLLHHCVQWDILSESILRSLQKQFAVKWRGILPAEAGLMLDNDQACKSIFQFIPAAPKKVRDMHYNILFSSTFGEETRCDILQDIATEPSFTQWLTENKSWILGAALKNSNLKIIITLWRTNELFSGEQKLADIPNLLWHATDLGSVEVMKYLLSDYNESSQQSILNAEAPDGTTPLAIAMATINLEAIRLILTNLDKDSAGFRMACDAVSELERMIGPGGNGKLSKVRDILEDCGAKNRQESLPSARNDTDPCLIKMSQDFPYINEEVEVYWLESKTKVTTEDDPTEYININRLDEIVLSDLCIRSFSGTWRLGKDVDIFPCKHGPIWTRTRCETVHEMIRFAKLLEVELEFTNDLMRNLKPRLTLVGSAAEGTRIAIANEIDLLMSFNGWRDPPFKVEKDPFTLKKTEWSPPWMSSYFEAGSFLYNEFKLDLLTAVEFAVTVICANHQSRLERITTNGAYRFRQRTYDPTSLHMQDVESAVTVSQSKIGICLQFQCPVAVGEEKFTEATGKRERVWSVRPVYCSIDLIPEFKIEEMKAMRLAKVVNSYMLGPERPTGWFKCLVNYVKHDKVLQELSESDDEILVTSVILKTLNCWRSQNHYIRPAQLLGQAKFATKGLKQAYCHLKALKKILGLDFSMYGVKKELKKSVYQTLAAATSSHTYLLYHVLRQPDIRKHFEGSIDFGMWKKMSSYKGYIPVTRKVQLPIWGKTFEKAAP